MKFLLLAAVLGCAYADIKCPPGKVVNQCGDLCQVTCKDVTNNNVPKACIEICNPPACVCPEGQALFRGQCVAYGHCWRLPPEDDPTSKKLECPTGKVLDPCGDLCEVTCHDVTTNNIPKSCPKICHEPACVCPNGTARHQRGRTCVPYGGCWRMPTDTLHLDQSSSSSSSESSEEPNELETSRAKNTPLKVCGPHEEYSSCGRRCEKTCLTWHFLNPFCASGSCVFGDCTCKDGYARNEQGTCVLPTQCPNLNNPEELGVFKVKDPITKQEKQMHCPENEFVNECGNACEKTCENALNPGPCPFICAPPACQCKSGYVRSKSGKCIEVKKCFKGETLLLSNRIPSELKSSEKNQEDQNGKKNQELSGIHIRHRCGRNMEYQECGYPCERTCREVVEHRSPPIACIAMCKPPGCYCKPGFVRFYNGQHCVRETECLL
uniref:TIL domain-containing protein n=1 Tax=Romanomermis culicivorax TaxID=13658 RepID=A0A915IGR8_ROMCU